MKAKSSFIFLVFNLVLMIGFLRLYSFLSDYFSDRKELASIAAQMKERAEHEKLRAAILQNQLWDFQQDVAEVLPNYGIKVKSVLDYRLAELSQTVRAPASSETLAFSAPLMDQGRRSFREGKYSEAARTFRSVIEKFPSSSQVIEAHFLLGESLFQEGRTDECLDTVYTMLNLFPESEMTGYLLLRNGQILQSRNRADEAKQLYDLVIRQFPSDKPLREQARRLASEK